MRRASGVSPDAPWLLYCRVSSDEQAEHGLGIEDQEERLTEDPRGDGAILVKEDFSGRFLYRPEMEKVLRLIEERRIQGILVARWDRLARSVVVGLHIVELCQAKGILFDSLEEPFRDTDEGWKAMREGFGASEDFVVALRRQLMRGKERKLRGVKQKNGLEIPPQYPLGTTGFGLKLIWPPALNPDPRHPHQRNDIIATSPEAVALVQELYHRVGALEHGVFTIQKDWFARGLRDEKGAVFSRVRLRKMIRNTLYKGLATYGLSKRERIKPLERSASKHKRYRLSRDEARQAGALYEIPYPNAAMVSPDLWEKANRRLDLNTKLAAGRPPRHDSLFHRHLWCGGHGGAMRLMVRTPTGRNYAYYRCASRATESRCALPTMNATWLDGELFNAIREAIDQPKLWRDAVSAALHQRPAELQKSIAQLREEIAKDERALKRAYQHMVESDDPRDRQLYLDERAERRARIAGAESKIYELEGLLRAMTAKTIEDFADRQRQAFRKATSLDEKARLIRPIVYKIVVDPAGDSAKIFLVRHPAAEGSAVHNPLVRKLGDPFQWRIQFSHSDSRHNPTPDGGLIALLVKLGPRPNFGRPPDWRLRRAWRQRGGGKP